MTLGVGPGTQTGDRRPSDAAPSGLPAPAPAAVPAPAVGSAPASASVPVTPGSPPRRNHFVLMAVGVLVVLAAVFGTRQYLWGRTHIATDDAQVEGHIIPVLPKLSGFVEAVNVVENQRVHTGDLLVQLDDREAKAKLAQAEGDLAAALANTGGNGQPGQAQAQIASARALVAEAEADAQRAHADAQRYRSLAPGGYVSPLQLDAAEAAAKDGDAKLDLARRQVTVAEAGLGGANARVQALRAARDQAALALSWTRLPAPADGIVSRKSVEVGQLVQVGQPLMDVVPLEDVWIVANLKETEIAGVKPGDHAEVKVDSYPGRTFPARLESLSPATGARFSLLPPDNATGNFTKVVQRVPVRLHLDGPQDPAHPLRPGMSVSVTIATK